MPRSDNTTAEFAIRLPQVAATLAAAKRERDETIVAAHAAGMSYREIARHLGDLTHSRVQQIVNAAR